jgi:hypothetical protein
MTAVLLDSRIQGSTGWVSLRTGAFVLVSGVETGDKLRVSFMPGGEELLIAESGTFSLPSEAKFLKIKHEEVALREKGRTGVCVDVVKKGS